MKKRLVTVSLFASLVLLSACQSSSKKESATKSAPSGQTSTSQTSSQAVETSTAESSSSSTLASSPSSAAEKPLDYDTLYADTLAKVAADDNAVTLYAFYDIDGNGTKELLTGDRSSDGKVYALALYYLKNGVSTYLAHSQVAPAGGYRADFSINSNGTVTQYEWTSHEGKGTAKTYRIQADNSGLVTLSDKAVVMESQEQVAEADPNPLELSSLEWKELVRPSQTKVTEKSSLDLEAIAQGDLSSIAGTYPAAKGGMDFTINADGTGSISKSDGTWDFQFSNFRMENGMAQFNASFAGATYAVVPAGQASPNDLYQMFGDDSSRNRVLITGEGINVFFLD
ncbi:DUF6287 domain-containing protein [Streptococcus cuniculipharyngis]|uniref:DUF6287 domain-containing protein n=1 Tax=Streptococcus cuniculipharyngis TaxID=1562651 RepID=A0A5C5SBU4_9STRE|nr:DUF6287 domain-containing protein [Streptococcus cuniculipharyngis]TWS97392.1 hypothetical protein FRX57_05580 [Streptococcus cuniculipharyngis]